MLRNGAESFGLVSRLLHWGIAGLVVVMLSLGLRLEDMQPGLANLWLYGLHKSLGLLTLSLMLARILWHLYSPPPRPIGGGWQARAARATHGAIYLLLLAIPLSGWIGSAATGLDVVIFDRWTLPAIAPVSPDWEARAFALHDALTKVLILLLFLHMGAALKREMDGDGTLRRMITGRARD
ncbi:cytochrome b [Tabrizicola sp. TH137]|uniref:cytochrome b n=1 Tax=Tabrizicola sp. TH137 TaxID=2067452 RepID=UPI000C7A2E59|nr:cytochrome b [Tabrizicola sp. TH137]PLL10781.1 cytochrome b [Tabrizicola sp. TH137]